MKYWQLAEVKICDGGLRIRGGWRSEYGTRVPRLGARSGLRLQTKFTNIARLSKFSQISESTVNIVLLLDCEIISGWEKLNPERPKIHGLSD